MAYSELIKNFDSVRGYMREFFIYGFKSREDYADKKSLRSYDNEKRRIESYLGDYVSFRNNNGGKQVFISMASKEITHNPLYKAFKAKSFTNKDITLHFLLMDILSGGEHLMISEICDFIESDYLAEFDDHMSFDESTVRKKLKEYIELGFVENEKEGKCVRYFAREHVANIEDSKDAIRFFTEENILGVIGSFIEDKMEPEDGIYTFKNHFIMNACDSEIVEKLLRAIHEKRSVTIANSSRKDGKVHYWHMVPLKIYASSANGRQHLIARGIHGQLLSLRIDYINDVTLEDTCDTYDEALRLYESKMKHLWGVNISSDGHTEHLEMDVYVGDGEGFIIDRLNREKRCGTVEKINDNLYRYSADVYDANEMTPWIRTFIGRIVRLESDNDFLMNNWKKDMQSLIRMYEV